MKRSFKRSTHFKTLICVAVVFAVSIAAFVGAYYLRKTDDVVNKFSPATTVQPKIVEKFKENDKTLKEDVYFEVGVTDDYPVYVRAAIVITWKNSIGDVYFSEPQPGADYSMDLNLDPDGWIKESDGFYYYKPSVPSGGATDILINSCKQLPGSNPPGEDNYTLSVEVIVQTVQAIGYTDEDNPNGVIPAYKDAWGLTLQLSEPQ